MYLERLARTYWRFLTRVTLGLVRMRYSQTGRSLVLLAPGLRLITFAAPEYDLEPGHGIVRWRIARGLLVARRGRGGGGHLQIDVRRLAGESPESARLHVEVEVAGFYPAIASGLGRRVYGATQSRIHVLVTHGFLRSLARLDLAESRIGRFAEAILLERFTVKIQTISAPAADPHGPRAYPRSAASFARSCVALIRRIVPERVRITSDSVVAPPALG